MRRSTPFSNFRSPSRSEEHTSELQSRLHLVCRLLLEKKKQYAEALPQKLDATRRDLLSVAWLSAVPSLLSEALTHFEARYRADTAIRVTIATSFYFAT